MGEYSSKLKRQVALLTVFAHREAIKSFNVIRKNVPNITLRTLERDIKELNEAGFMDVKYYKTDRIWHGEVYIPDKAPEMSLKRRKDFDNLVHFEYILFTMKSLEFDEVDNALYKLHQYQEMYEWWEEDDKYGPEPKYDKADLNEDISADKAYFRIFPNATKADFEKDVRFLCDIGYPIEYSEELNVYYTNYPEQLIA